MYMLNRAFNLKIKVVTSEKIDEGFQVIWEVFREFVAPDYTQEGIDCFYSEFIKSEQFRKKFLEGREVMYGAYIDDELTGVLCISVMNTVSCVFVKGKYHRMGIGKKLFEAVIEKLKYQGVTEITLNASPYALPFYHAIGFCDTNVQSTYKGIVYTPMALLLDKRD